MANNDPRIPEANTSDNGHRVDVYDGPQNDHDTHTVINTAADGWTTQDFERVADNDGNRTVLIDTGYENPYQGNVISGSDQYDEGYPG